MGRELRGKENDMGGIAVDFGEGEIYHYPAPLVLRDGEAGLDFSKLRATPNPKDPPMYRGKFYLLKSNHVCKAIHDEINAIRVSAIVVEENDTLRDIMDTYNVPFEVLQVMNTQLLE